MKAITRLKLGLFIPLILLGMFGIAMYVNSQIVIDDCKPQDCKY